MIIPRSLPMLSRTMDLTTLTLMREMVSFWTPMLQVVNPHNHIVDRLEYFRRPVFVGASQIFEERVDSHS